MDNIINKGESFIEKIKALGIGGGAIAILGFLAQIQFEWWSIALVAFFVGAVLGKTPALSFAYGTAAVTFLWATYAGIQASTNNNIISNMMGNMLGGALTGMQLVMATGLIGGLVGGFATMAGAQLRELISGR
jgi:hypothetical protein